MEEKMELMDSWMEGRREFDEKSVLHINVLSLQLKMVNDGCLAVVDVHVKDNFMAAASSS